MLKNKVQVSRIKILLSRRSWMLGGLGWCVSVSATVFAPQPFPKTIHAAPVIVWGQVGMSYSEWSTDPNGTKRIYTFYELQVFEVLKGQIAISERSGGGGSGVSRGSIMMREMGGTKDGLGMNVDGAAHFDRGEEVVVFLSHPHFDQSFDVFGMALGKYGVIRNETGEKLLSGLGLFENGYDPNSQEPQKKWTIEDVKNIIFQQDHSIQHHTVASEAVANHSQHKNVQQVSERPSMGHSPASSAIPSAVLLETGGQGAKRGVGVELDQEQVETSGTSVQGKERFLWALVMVLGVFMVVFGLRIWRK